MSIQSTGLSKEEARVASRGLADHLGEPDDPLVPIPVIRRELGNIAHSTVHELFKRGFLPKVKIFGKTLTRTSALRRLKATGTSGKAA